MWLYLLWSVDNKFGLNEYNRYSVLATVFGCTAVVVIVNGCVLGFATLHYTSELSNCLIWKFLSSNFHIRKLMGVFCWYSCVKGAVLRTISTMNRLWQVLKCGKINNNKKWILQIVIVLSKNIIHDCVIRALLCRTMARNAGKGHMTTITIGFVLSVPGPVLHVLQKE